MNLLRNSPWSETEILLEKINFLTEQLHNLRNFINSNSQKQNWEIERLELLIESQAIEIAKFKKQVGLVLNDDAETTFKQNILNNQVKSNKRNIKNIQLEMILLSNAFSNLKI